MFFFSNSKATSLLTDLTSIAYGAVYCLPIKCICQNVFVKNKEQEWRRQSINQKYTESSSLEDY